MNKPPLRVERTIVPSSGSRVFSSNSTIVRAFIGPLTSAVLACFVIIFPTIGYPQSAGPQRGDQSSSVIIGIVPHTVVSGQPVKIYMSGQQSYSVDAVEIGGRIAKISDRDGDSVTVTTPQEITCCEQLPVQLFGRGLSLTSPELVTVARNSTSGVNWQSRIISFAIAILLLSFLGVGVLVIRSYRRKFRALTSEHAHLKFLFERTGPQFDRMASQSLENWSNRSDESPSAFIPDIPSDLIDALKGHRCTLFWGGGLSAQAGYPTWKEAFAQLTSELDNQAQQTAIRRLLASGKSGLAVEGLINSLGRDRVVRATQQLWGDNRPVTPAIRDLAKLPFSNAVTPVWDNLIGQVFNHRRPVTVTGITSDSLEPLLLHERFCILHLWGTLARPETLLFTPSDFRTEVASNPTFAKYLSSFALQQTHLFLGASVETIDDYFSVVPRTLSSRTHYALVSDEDEIESVRDTFKSRYGVELLLFKASPGWPEVPAFISRLAELVGESSPADAVELQPIRLNKVKLENIGAFDNVELDLDKHWNVLLGNNGCGKSTVLRSIALVLCGDDSRALKEGERLLREGTSKGAVELIVGDDVFRTELSRDANGTVHVNVATRVSPLKAGKWVALAFPPLRGISTKHLTGPTQSGSSSPIVEDVLPLLEGTTDERLASLKQWLINLDFRSTPGAGITEKQALDNRKLQEHFFSIFNAFVPSAQVEFARINRQTWQVKVISNGHEVELEQVSQGVNSMLGWIGTLLQRMYEIYGAVNITAQTAVVLIDEIDAHLHPDWQQRIIITLKDQFPNVQFIATTHSPLIVGELETNQIFKFSRRDGQLTVANPLYVKGMGYAGLLTSNLFDLDTTIDSKTLALLEQQRQLTTEDRLSDSQREELERINEQLEMLGFRYLVRDQEYSDYLKERRRLMVRAGLSPLQLVERERREQPGLQELIRDAIQTTMKKTGRGE